MTELESAMAAFTETKKAADTNLDEIPYRMRAGWESKKRDAQAVLEDRKTAYQNALGKAIFGVMVLGKSSDAFTKIAAEEAEVLVVDGAEIYKRIVNRVLPAIGNSREFGVSHFGIVIQELRQIAGELNIVEMDAPKWLEPTSMPNEEALARHVRGMVDSSAGAGLLKFYISNQIAEAGIKAQVTKNTVPVLITGLTPEMASAVSKGLFDPNRIITTTASTEPTKESVLEVFNQIKRQLKLNKKQASN